MLKKGMLIADRYEIIEKIGSGGMSDVYRARCHKLNRFVAIKVLKQEFSEDENFVSKFRIEAQSVAGLTHANIVNVYDVGDEAGIYYIVMELVEGITLKNYIDKKGKLVPKEAVSIAIQVAQGIEAAHNHGIVHRDIKPQNIIISREGKVKVTDFGIARAASSNTINSNVMGSVHYISPEQARGGYSDYKSDIYSFGIMLFEMLTGRVPFEGDTTVSIALKHIQEEVPSVRDVDDTIPIAVSQIVEKCTRKRKENRYDSATELIVDLKKALVNPDVAIISGSTAGVSGADSKTVMITKEEIAQIENAAKQGEKVAVAGVIKNNTSNIPKTTGKELQKSEELELEEEKESESSNMDKILMAIGICAALIILGVAIYVVVWAFDSIKSTNTSNNKPTKSTEYTTSSDGKVEVPPILGMDGTAAKKLLNERGLGYVVTENVSSDLYEKGKVVSQSIDSGNKVNPNTTIYVTLSSGPEAFSLEDYSNKDYEETKKILEEQYGLNVTTEYEYSNDVEFGKIIKTDIKAGTTVKRGNKITLYVSRGKETKEATVPNILGLTEQAANEKLEKNGLIPGKVLYAYSSKYKEGTVMTQDYREGKVVNSGTKVGYTISKGPEPTQEVKYEYQGEVTIYKSSFESNAKAGEKNVEGKVTKTEIKLVLSQNGKETVIMDTKDINDISQSQFKFMGADGVTSGKVIMYARYTYIPEGSGDSATDSAAQSTKVTDFISIWTTDVTLKKTEVN